MPNHLKTAHRKRRERARRWRVALCACFVGLAALPAFQRLTRFPPDTRLRGAEIPRPGPALNWTTWFDGTYARDWEGAWAQRVGFRGFFVKVANQINYSVFRQTPRSMGTGVTLGKDHWLYETVYVDHYVKPAGMSQEAGRAFAGRLRRLQDALARHGVWFCFVISPVKPEIYPEHLPEGIRKPAGPRAASAYESLRPQLDAAGVNLMDGHELFLRWKHDHPPLFAKGGTHWNYYGCFLFYRELVRFANRCDPALEVPVPELADVVHLPPQGADDDLLRLLNLFRFEPRGRSPVPYPVVKVARQPLEARPEVLVVGDSLAAMLIDAMRYSHTPKQVDILYYFKRHGCYRWPDVPEGWAWDRMFEELEPMDPQRFDLRGLLLRKRIVILECSEFWIQDKGWGFPEKALEALEAPAH